MGSGKNGENKMDIDQLIRDAYEKMDTKALLLVWHKFAYDIVKKIVKDESYKKEQIIEFINDEFLNKAKKKHKVGKNPKGFVYRLLFNEFKNFFRKEYKKQRFLNELIQIYPFIYLENDQDAKKETAKEIVWEHVLKILNNCTQNEKMIADSIMGKVKNSEVIERMNISTRRYYYETHLLLKKIRCELYQLAKSNSKLEDIIIDGFGHDALKKLTCNLSL